MKPAHQAPLVFVVDDDPMTNRMVQGILSRAGFRTVTAFTAATALSGIREHHPDLVLLDVNLPDGNGLDVCRQLQGQPGMVHTPVLFISANEDVPSKLRVFEAGGVDYIPKPVAMEEVLARVTTHLRLKQAFESLADLQAERIQHLAVAQETLMPQPADFPEAGFQVGLRQILEAGGDFYDVIPVGEKIIDYVVADASGHDLAASFWTASLKTLLGEYATPANSPRHVLRCINQALRRILPAGVYFTVLYARLNRHTGRLLVINAGHPPALLHARGSNQLSILHQEGDVLGAFADSAFEMRELQVRRGDRLFLFSDGLIELNSSREEGLARLSSALMARQLEPLARQIQSVHQELLSLQTPTDDILLMGVEV
jgi:phosphoserine phosphatase RsbU/P